MEYTDEGDIDLDTEAVRRRDGSRITEADAEAQGQKITRRGPGRQLEHGDVDVSADVAAVSVSVWFRGDELEAVERAAAAAGMNLSAFIRQIALGASGP